MPSRTSTGLFYEEMAAVFLKKKGLKEIIRNFRHRTGEIDLIMQHQETVVFVEVRYRYQNTYGSAEESITPQKQQKIISTANFYLTRQKLWDNPCRFDTVTIKPSKHPFKQYDINWIISAFN